MLRRLQVTLCAAGLAAGCGCAGGACRGAALQRPAPASRPEPATSLPAPGASVAPAAAATDHPTQAMFRGDPARRGRTPRAIPVEAPAIRWRFPTDRAIFGSPAVDGEGNIYFGSLDGHLYSLRSGGTLRWSRNLGDRVYASPALSADGVLVGSDADRFFLLEAATGRPRWSFTLGHCSRDAAAGPGPETVRCNADSSPAVTRDGVFFGGDALYALRLDGSLRWRAPLAGHAFSSPALDAQGNLFVGTQVGVASFDAAGKKRWERTGLYGFDASPALTPGGLVVVGSDDGRLHALRSSDGSEAWVHPTRGPVLSSAAVASDGGVVFGSDDGRLRSLGPDGKLRWSFATRGPLRSSPLLDAAGRVLVGSEDDQLYALDAGGRLLWSLALPADLDASPVLSSDGTILVGCDDGQLYGVR